MQTKPPLDTPSAPASPMDAEQIPIIDMPVLGREADGQHTLEAAMARRGFRTHVLPRDFHLR